MILADGGPRVLSLFHGSLNLNSMFGLVKSYQNMMCLRRFRIGLDPISSGSPSSIVRPLLN